MVDGEWEDDLSSDFGRIARQQDFIRRALQKALDRGARQPLVANQLVDAALSNVTVDSNLTVGDMYDLATRLRAFDPDTVKTYRIDGAGVIIGGASVIQPDTTSRRARAILDYFRGEATGVDEDAADDASSGDQGSSTTTRASSTTTESSARSTTSTRPPRAGSGETRDDPSTSTTLDAAGRPDDFVTGIIPPDDPSCR
jgi:anionic cell wall polymer biosynthesis LytR-Cps2A-Psr (LCP) family protein